MSVKKIAYGDENFSFQEDGEWHHRAGIEIVENKIPDEYKRVVIECFKKNWIRPVAYIRDNELMWEKLRG